ncbi:MAG: acyl carrier protein [Lachnospiraceae bacterium]|nr:acyl carrier protein [Lachnospiraceae bacterium]
MILEKIKEMLAEQEFIDGSTITPETTFEELELDSLSLVDLTMSCEEEFGVSLDNQLENPPKTIGELIDIIKAQTGEE